MCDVNFVQSAEHYANARQDKRHRRGAELCQHDRCRRPRERALVASWACPPAQSLESLDSNNLNFVLRIGKIFLVLHLRRGGHQFAVLDAFGGDELAGDLVDLVGPAAYDDNFETVVLV